MNLKNVKPGDLVTVHPYGRNLYLVVSPSTDDYWADGGNIWNMYCGITGDICAMSEKYLEVLNESS
tara:strand:+ start:5891 stop:6088 length:198 start_codon:yes stop_codon:yes gene_type:complete